MKDTVPLTVHPVNSNGLSSLWFASCWGPLFALTTDPPGAAKNNLCVCVCVCVCVVSRRKSREIDKVEEEEEKKEEEKEEEKGVEEEEEEEVEEKEEKVEYIALYQSWMNHLKIKYKHSVAACVCVSVFRK